MAQQNETIGGVGARIAELRVMRDLSQHALGRRAHVSQSHLNRIESGDREASPGIVAAIADVLGVSVSVLRGQPYIHMLQADELDALLSPIAGALEAWDIVDDDVPEPRALDELEAEVKRVVAMRLRAEIAEVAELLPALISEVSASVLRHDQPGRERERAYALQAETARSAASVAYRLGYPELARLAIARMALAAPHSGDPRVVAVERWERAEMSHFALGRPDRSLTLVRQALRDLDDDGDSSTRAVRGALLLRGAVAARRARRPSEADDLRGEAEELSRATGDVSVLALNFGPTFVAMNAITELNDASEHEEALSRSLRFRIPEQWTPNVRAHYWIDRARAAGWTARRDDALESLSQARAAAPEMTRYHPEVHETVSVLLRARRRADEHLLEFAQWSGV